MRWAALLLAALLSGCVNMETPFRILNGEPVQSKKLAPVAPLHKGKARQRPGISGNADAPQSGQRMRPGQPTDFSQRFGQWQKTDYPTWSAKP